MQGMPRYKARGLEAWVASHSLSLYVSHSLNELLKVDYIGEYYRGYVLGGLGGSTIM